MDTLKLDFVFLSFLRKEMKKRNTEHFTCQFANMYQMGVLIKKGKAAGAVYLV